MQMCQIRSVIDGRKKKSLKEKRLVSIVSNLCFKGNPASMLTIAAVVQGAGVTTARACSAVATVVIVAIAVSIARTCCTRGWGGGGVCLGNTRTSC